MNTRKSLRRILAGVISRSLRLLRLFGLDFCRTAITFRGLPWFIHDLWLFQKQAKDSTVRFPLRLNPYLDERSSQSGGAGGHYFHQDMHVARRIFEQSPRKHVDVGSRIDGFVPHVASFREIEVFDIRPQMTTIPNIVFRQADLLQLDRGLTDYCDSLSCLHALEHFGLGRYGDPVCFDGFVRGFENIGLIVRSGGTFYFSVPIGPPRVEFNAHRVFSLRYLLDVVTARFAIRHFSYVDQRGDFHPHVTLTEESVGNNCGCDFGCGIFELVKR